MIVVCPQSLNKGNTNFIYNAFKIIVVSVTIFESQRQAHVRYQLFNKKIGISGISTKLPACKMAGKNIVYEHLRVCDLHQSIFLRKPMLATCRMLTLNNLH